MHISVSDYDLMARDTISLIRHGVEVQPAVDTIAAENDLNHKQRNILTTFVDVISYGLSTDGIKEEDVQ